jgi:hypothetical protein
MPTGFDMIQEAAVYLGEGRSTLAQLQSQLWPKHIKRAANYLARHTWHRYKALYCDIIGPNNPNNNNSPIGQHQYRMPAVPFEESAATINDGSGNTWPIGIKTPSQMDNDYWLWRNNPAIYVGIPFTLIARGANEFELFWTPSYSCQKGISIEGYYDYQDWDLADPFPDDEPYYDAVLIGAQFFRCDELSDDARYANKMANKKGMFDEMVTDLYAKSVTQNEARRQGGPGAGIARMGPWSGQAGGGS